MRRWKIAALTLAMALVAKAGITGEFPEEATLKLMALGILRDSLDVQRTVPSDGDINYRVTTPNGVVDFLVLEQTHIRDLANVANDAARELQEMEYLVRLYAVIKCEPARGAARKLIAGRFNGAASGLDTNIKMVGDNLQLIKTPAAAAIGVRLRDHLREAAALLRSEGKDGR